jgi:hypothetical protein
LQYLYFLTKVALLAKKVDQLPVKSKLWKLGIDTLITWFLKTKLEYNCPEKNGWNLAQLIRVSLIETEKEEDFDAVTVHLQIILVIIINFKSLLEYNEKLFFINCPHQHLHQVLETCCKGIVAGGIDLKTLRTPFPNCDP